MSSPQKLTRSVNEGDRIAQLILERISHARVNQVEVSHDSRRIMTGRRMQLADILDAG